MPRTWRHCGQPGCQCDHKHCAHGILDDLVETVAPDGRIYFASQRCPACTAARVHPQAPHAQQPLFLPGNVIPLVRRSHVQHG